MNIFINKKRDFKLSMKISLHYAYTRKNLKHVNTDILLRHSWISLICLPADLQISFESKGKLFIFLNFRFFISSKPKATINPLLLNDGRRRRKLPHLHGTGRADTRDLHELDIRPFLDFGQLPSDRDRAQLQCLISH